MLVLFGILTSSVVSEVLVGRIDFGSVGIGVKTLVRERNRKEFDREYFAALGGQNVQSLTKDLKF